MIATRSAALVVFEVRLLVLLRGAEGIDHAEVKDPAPHGTQVVARECRRSLQPLVALAVEDVRYGDDRGEVWCHLVLVADIHDVDGAQVALRGQTFVRAGHDQLRRVCRGRAVVELQFAVDTDGRLQSRYAERSSIDLAVEQVAAQAVGELRDNMAVRGELESTRVVLRQISLGRE